MQWNVRSFCPSSAASGWLTGVFWDVGGWIHQAELKCSALQAVSVNLQSVPSKGLHHTSCVCVCICCSLFMGLYYYYNVTLLKVLWNKPKYIVFKTTLHDNGHNCVPSCLQLSVTLLVNIIVIFTKKILTLL